MEVISAKKLLAGLCEAPDEPITAVVTDSRLVQPGCVFVCFPGQRVDGHDFAAQAYARGASWIVANHPVEDVPAERTILAPDSRIPLCAMAANYRACYTPWVVGVTGSVGKTTTKEFCAAALAAFGETLKTEGNRNNEIGLPGTLFRLERSTQYAVVEMGMSALGEIHRLSLTAQPDAGVITGIGVSHLETLGSRENILKAKLEICDGLRREDGKKAPLILNGDDPYLRGAQLPDWVEPIWCGIQDENCRIRAVDIRHEERGERFTIRDEELGLFEAFIPTVGLHAVQDALFAYAAAVTRPDAGRADALEAAAALADYQAAGMRQRLVEKGGVKVLEDCYNASPDSMRAAFEAFGRVECTRRFALLGDMLELGSVSEEAHRQVGQLAAGAKLDCLVTYGPASQETAKEAQRLGVPEVLHCETREEAAQALSQRLRPGDGLLAKGSRGMRLEEILKMVYNRL